MANLINVPGFEAPGWALSGAAALDADQVRSGSASLHLEAANGTDSGAISPALTATEAGQQYRVKAWFYRADEDPTPGQLSQRLQVWVHRSGVRAIELQQQRTPTVPPLAKYARVELGTFIADGTEDAIEFDYDLVGFDFSYSGTVHWHVDDLTMEADVISTLIRNAIVADLQDVDSVSFEIDVGAVYEEPVLEGNRVYPYYELGSFEGFEADPSQLTNKEGETVSTFTVIGGVMADGALPELMKLVDSARNALERGDGNVLALGAVDQIDVTGAEVHPASDDITNKVRQVEMTVAVKYHYTRGAA